MCRRGVISADVDNDLLKVAVFDRKEGFSPAFGFIRGLGTDIGAVGTTVNLDEYTLLVAGSSDYDMAYCANLLLEAGGGVGPGGQRAGSSKRSRSPSAVSSPWNPGATWAANWPRYSRP